MSLEQHKGDNHQGKTRKEGKKTLSRWEGGKVERLRVGFFPLEPGFVFCVSQQTMRCLANVRRTVSTWMV